MLIKKKYLNCPLMKHCLHFFHDNIRTCCANAPGINFFPDYNGEEIDWDYVYNCRKKVTNKINSIFNTESVPKECENCFEINSYLSDKKINDYENFVDKIYIQNYMSCNVKCEYCTFKHIEKGLKYRVTPIIKSLMQKELLSRSALIYMSGGEITISPEFEELLTLFLSYLNSKITILTSGVKYSKSIELAFIDNKMNLLISLDSGCAETYKKIKNADCFDIVINNLKSYISAAESAKNNITLKYIIVDGINDNLEEINKFMNVVKLLGITKVRFSEDFVKYSINDPAKIPPRKHKELYNEFNELVKNNGLNSEECMQTLKILEKIKD